jgi:hypothetical protein
MSFGAGGDRDDWSELHGDATALPYKEQRDAGLRITYS